MSIASNARPSAKIVVKRPTDWLSWYCSKTLHIAMFLQQSLKMGNLAYLKPFSCTKESKH